MPKRIGYLYEKVISLDNCILAEKKMAKNKTDNRRAKEIGLHAEEYGQKLYNVLLEKRWKSFKNKEYDIVDSYKGKTRHLKVPCLFDQAVQYAWLNIATPYIEKRNYYYNCGSIPGAGQIRAVRALQKWLKVKKNRPRYSGVSDIRHFYETCPHETVMKGLRRIFKDEEFLALAQQILNSMSDNGVGLAIGHPSSHWFGNVALMEVDKSLERNFREVKFVRYMDDVVMVSNNKRKLKKAMEFQRKQVALLGMEIKSNWQVFKIKDRGISFLSYRFFHEYTVLSKKLMYRISKRCKGTDHRDLKYARTVVSYNGILKHCNSYRFREKYIYPYTSMKKCRKVISNEGKNAVFNKT